jgi:hypothetical protein
LTALRDKRVIFQLALVFVEDLESYKIIAVRANEWCSRYDWLVVLEPGVQPLKFVWLKSFRGRSTAKCK